MIAIIIRGLLALCLTVACLTIACGQDPPSDEPDFIVPARPTGSNPAEFQKPGVLQLEFGFNSNS